MSNINIALIKSTTMLFFVVLYSLVLPLIFKGHIRNISDRNFSFLYILENFVCDRVYCLYFSKQLNPLIKNIL